MNSLLSITILWGVLKKPGWLPRLPQSLTKFPSLSNLATRELPYPSETNMHNLSKGCSLDVLTHFRIAGAAAAGRTIAQEFLSSCGAINFAYVNISIGIDSHHVGPVKLACLAAAASKATEFREVLSVDDIDYVIEEIGYVHASLL